MNELLNKYRKDKLTPPELTELKDNVNSKSDTEIEEEMRNIWLGEDIDTSAVDEEMIKRIKTNCDQAIGKKRINLSSFARWAQIAAAILLPVFIAFSIYLYHENSLILSNEMLVTTGKAERATITLPDGTIVSLNAESALKYMPKDYNKKERKIDFNGEGYFQVHRDQHVPFLIDARGLHIEVLGTTFNLYVRDTDNQAILTLEEGSVSLLSVQNNQKVILKKNQKAILDQATGQITVFDDENVNEMSAWRRGDMIFRNTELSEVIRTIEESYDVAMTVECKDCLKDSFTGTLPINDLNEVLEVLEQSYHLKATLNGKKIIMR
ncbi:FecR family protein [Prevotella sp. 10(H)]|uniref:FecR family protein n=1 Tax=Prevotella sp. 10(H) TaxID=1158294 RepID=UPI0004A6FC9B|nr:FecR domain-containing protein [Prevotella sp. 10(H)]